MCKQTHSRCIASGWPLRWGMPDTLSGSYGLNQVGAATAFGKAEKPTEGVQHDIRSVLRMHPVQR